MRYFKNILVTGGSGFIGSNFIKKLLDDENHSLRIEKIINLDKLTYAGDARNNESYSKNPKYKFVQGDICSKELIEEILEANKIDLIINFAAESHVDNSIDGPKEFIETNIFGTFNLLECFRNNNKSLKTDKAFLHISTDEVYGSLKKDEKRFNELTSYKPNSPYSSSKASSDHLVRAWHKTYGLNTLITNCSNNYGPRQNKEKLIPKVISNALLGKEIPIYGDGLNIRDWLYVDDHCEAIIKVFSEGAYGETYNIGGLNEKTNIEIANLICNILDEVRPKKHSYKDLISFVSDRPGHDFRYSVNPEKLINSLDWKPRETFKSGIRKTVLWYLDNIF